MRFFPYNWLEDLNDSVKKLERDIRKNHYDSVIFVTHSTGGLLASAFIAKSNANKLLVSKAILIAAPLFGTYASLLPIERGDSRKFDFNEILSNIDWFSHGLDAITPKSWVRGWAKIRRPHTSCCQAANTFVKYPCLTLTVIIGGVHGRIWKLSVPLVVIIGSSMEVSA